MRRPKRRSRPQSESRLEFFAAFGRDYRSRMSSFRVGQFPDEIARLRAVRDPAA